MSTAVIGVGNIGSAVARHLVAGGEDVLVAGRTQEAVEQAAAATGSTAAASVAEAIAAADAVVLAVWFDVIQELVGEHGDALAGKVVIDPSNAIRPTSDGGFENILPAGTTAAGTLADGARRSPEVVLFYATDDAEAEGAVQRLIAAAGFAPVKAGGVDQAGRIEVGGDLHEMGGLDGRTLAVDEARSLAGA
jgi:predicted dinucleotide-binding enzyme